RTSVVVNLRLVLRFFFQAEDGIRDKLVTGVQTCALPIYASRVQAFLVQGAGDDAIGPSGEAFVNRVEEPIVGRLPGCDTDGAERSEERRVGKECRSGWSRER